jgi:hypothetical protein
MLWHSPLFFFTSYLKKAFLTKKQTFKISSAAPTGRHGKYMTLVNSLAFGGGST